MRQIRPHKVNFLFLVLEVTFSFFFFFFLETKVEKKMQQNALWRVRSGDKTTECIAWMVKPLSAGCVNTVVAC